MLLPPHEDVVRGLQCIVVECVRVERLWVGVERHELGLEKVRKQTQRQCDIQDSPSEERTLPLLGTFLSTRLRKGDCYESFSSALSYILENQAVYRQILLQRLLGSSPWEWGPRSPKEQLLLPLIWAKLEVGRNRNSWFRTKPRVQQFLNAERLANTTLVNNTVALGLWPPSVDAGSSISLLDVSGLLGQFLQTKISPNCRPCLLLCVATEEGVLEK